MTKIQIHDGDLSTYNNVNSSKYNYILINVKHLKQLYL